MRNKALLPGVLEQQASGVESRFSQLESVEAQAVHVDLLDGVFAPNFSCNKPVIYTPYSHKYLLELHMMVKEPLNYLEEYSKAGFKRFVAHVEMMSNQAEFVDKARQYGEVGLALDADTPLEALTVPHDRLESILVMTIKAGFAGQAFEPKLLTKVQKLRQKFSGVIEVDGGINEQTLVLAKKAGATRFVVNSALFKSANLHTTYDRLLKLI